MAVTGDGKFCKILMVDCDGVNNCSCVKSMRGRRNKLPANKLIPIKLKKIKATPKKAPKEDDDLRNGKVPDVLKQMMVDVKKLNIMINETKNTKSRVSRMPKLKLATWVRKLKEESISTIYAGAKPLKKPNTYSRPLKKNSKLMITDITKATT